MFFYTNKLWELRLLIRKGEFKDAIKQIGNIHTEASEVEAAFYDVRQKINMFDKHLGAVVTHLKSKDTQSALAALKSAENLINQIHYTMMNCVAAEKKMEKKAKG